MKIGGKPKFTRARTMRSHSIWSKAFSISALWAITPRLPCFFLHIIKGFIGLWWRLIGMGRSFGWGRFSIGLQWFWRWFCILYYRDLWVENVELCWHCQFWEWELSGYDWCNLALPQNDFRSFSCSAANRKLHGCGQWWPVVATAMKYPERDMWVLGIEAC